MVLFLQGVESEPPDEYINYLLCEKFGIEIMNQPASFVEGLLLVMSIKKKAQKWQKPANKLTKQNGNS